MVRSITRQRVKYGGFAVALLVTLSGCGTQQPQTENIPYTSERPANTQQDTPQPSVQIATPDTLLWQTPFVPQAPNANWDLPYQEACEEAAALTAHAFIENKETLGTADHIDRQLLDLVDVQNKMFGYYEDTTLEEVRQMMREKWGYAEDVLRIIEAPTVEQIKSALAEQSVVLVPTSGKELRNPNFRNGGPKYHFVVIIGYTKNQFIVHDPGTRKGKEYRYDIDVLMNAMHDWNGGDVLNGEKRVLVASRLQ